MSGPIDPVAYRDERFIGRSLTGEGWAEGLDVWGPVGKAYGDFVGDGALANAQLWSLRQAVYAEGYARAKADAAVMYGEDGAAHQAHRGSDVEAWIKRYRDSYLDADGTRTFVWQAVDDLLDDYRDHADTGTPLSEPVTGPYEES